MSPSVSVLFGISALGEIGVDDTFMTRTAHPVKLLHTHQLHLHFTPTTFVDYLSKHQRRIEEEPM
jgi:hypothetical protein